MAWINNVLARLQLPFTPRGRQAFKKTLTEADLMAGDVQVLAGKFNKIGELVVPAQQSIAWGQGDPSQPDNQGYMYVSLKDTSATPVQVEGLVRLAISNAHETNITVVFEERTEKLRGSATDRKLMIPLPEFRGRVANEDDRLQVYLKPDANVTVSKANSDLLLPVTVYITP